MTTEKSYEEMTKDELWKAFLELSEELYEKQKELKMIVTHDSRLGYIATTWVNK